jgi:class 3 adenylate cyclase
MQITMLDFNSQYGTAIQLRIGICTGPVIAGVIGRKTFAYDLWGDTVNLASRLQVSADPGSIHVSQTTFEKLKELFRFDCGHTTELKGFGPTLIHCLRGS